MDSMTGYGASERLTEEYLLSLEIKSYNNRYLELATNLPSVLGQYEIAINERVKESLLRGRVEVYVRLRQLKSNYNLHVDEATLREYEKVFQKVATLSNLKNKIDLKTLIALEGVVVPLYQGDASIYEEPLFSLLDEALATLKASRSKEGEATKEDLVKSATQIASGVEVVKGHAQELEGYLKGEMVNKIEELLGDKGYDEGRVLQEVAIQLNRATINEEIVRLEAHLKAFFEGCEASGAIGKRLDFLAQEMNREINTIGSKSVLVPISQQVVTMKEALENIREQLRNIE
ncbi:MAG: YicC/YloC family endoribonuclease [Sphaerochaetaceae bacterium]|jgi:uncharacterized protein (TIGR00255 family)|nr:YicC family protein [Sphaerochaetaceae bacterium]HHU89335.1 YicC family protein [Spirochaetales bacterium]